MCVRLFARIVVSLSNCSIWNKVGWHCLCKAFCCKDYLNTNTCVILCFEMSQIHSGHVYISNKEFHVSIRHCAKWFRYSPLLLNYLQFFFRLPFLCLATKTVRLQNNGCNCLVTFYYLAFLFHFLTYQTHDTHGFWSHFAHFAREFAMQANQISAAPQNAQFNHHIAKSLELHGIFILYRVYVSHYLTLVMHHNNTIVRLSFSKSALTVSSFCFFMFAIHFARF